MKVLPVETLVDGHELGRIMAYSRVRSLPINAAVHELLMMGLDAPRPAVVSSGSVDQSDSKADADVLAEDWREWLVSPEVTAALWKAGARSLEDVLERVARGTLKEIGGIGPVTEGKIIQALVDEGLILAVDHD